MESRSLRRRLTGPAARAGPLPEDGRWDGASSGRTRTGRAAGSRPRTGRRVPAVPVGTCEPLWSRRGTGEEVGPVPGGRRGRGTGPAPLRALLASPARRVRPDPDPRPPRRIAPCAAPRPRPRRCVSRPGRNAPRQAPYRLGGLVLDQGPIEARTGAARRSTEATGLVPIRPTSGRRSPRALRVSPVRPRIRPGTSLVVATARRPVSRAAAASRGARPSRAGPEEAVQGGAVRADRPPGVRR